MITVSAWVVTCKQPLSVCQAVNLGANELGLVFTRANKHRRSRKGAVITPASGWVGNSMESIIIGIAAGTVCYGCVAFKNARMGRRIRCLGSTRNGNHRRHSYRYISSPHIWDTGIGWVDNGDGTFAPCYIDTGDTAWMLTATSMVLFMTPGVAFFYGGLARSKNAVNVIGMTFVIMGIMAWQWVAWGYSLSFGPIDNDANMFMGALDYVGFNQVSHYAPLGAPTACDGDIWSNAYQMQQYES